MIHIILTILAVYTAGYLITLFLMCLGPDEPKAKGVKQKAQWGVFFAIVWPITLPIVIYTIPYSIITWIKRWKENKIRKQYQTEYNRRKELWKSNPPFQYAKPIPSDPIENAFDEDDDDDD